MSKLTKDNINNICKSYEDRISSCEIAKLYLITEGAVKYHLYKNNIKMRPKGFQNGNNFGIKFIRQSDIIINCKYCNKEFRVWESTLNPKNGRSPRSFCSLSCRSNFHKKEKQDHPMWKGGKSKCLDCDKLLSTRQVQRCLKCSGKNKTGENHWNYKDGKGEKTRTHTPEYKQWRKSVFLRDNYKCVRCNSEKELHAHHIVEWSKSIELRFQVPNGETLCRICHENHHYGRHR